MENYARGFFFSHAWRNQNEEKAREIEKFMWTAKLLILILCFNAVIIKLSSPANPLNLQLIMSLR